MEIIGYLVILSLLIAGGFLAAFIWAVSKGQYEDQESPAVRILLNDKKVKPE